VPLVLLGALWAWQALHRPPPPRPLANGAQLEWVDCWFEVSLWRPVHCARFRTAPEPGAASGFALPVVYVPARPWRRSASPLLYIAGGPGAATLLGDADLPDWLAWLDGLDWSFDTVFYDQRGVGLGRPALDCPEVLAERRAQLPLDLSTEVAGRRLLGQAWACRQRLEGQGHDLSVFSTRANARDARDLMAALGAPQWNLYAVSYGSRVALDLLRLAPETLRAVILDSVYPPEVQAELADPWLLARALALVGRICELTGECQRAPAAVAADIAQILARLRSRPLVATVPDPAGNGQLQVRYDAEGFAWLLFETLYRWDRLADLPGQLSALAKGEALPGLQALLADSVAAALDASFSDAVGGAVDCNDSTVVDAAAAAAERVLFPKVAPLLAHDWEFHPCRTWKSGDAGDAFRQPVRSAVPALLLAGEFDPVTPPHWADAAAAGLAQGWVIEFPGIGHGVLDSHACAVELAKAFLAEPRAPRAPDCLDRL
jgi:pimeloyl-ACP methyl ester carboxylesterase